MVSRLPLVIRVLLLVAAALSFLGWLFAQPRMPQPLSYHAFADQRTVLGIPHCLNVVSNVPFALVGALGIGFVLRGAPGLHGRADVALSFVCSSASA
jgi:hypothetical protein